MLVDWLKRLSTNIELIFIWIFLFILLSFDGKIGGPSVEWIVACVMSDVGGLCVYDIGLEELVGSIY